MRRSTKPAAESGVVITAARADATLMERAEALGQKLSLPVLSPGTNACADSTVLILVSADRLQLCLGHGGRRMCLDVDFVGGRTGFRRHSRPSKRQPIARAVGRHRGPVAVLDATAGLGRDAFLLACLGCRVTAVERSPVLFALVEDGQARARARSDVQLQAIMDRITFVQADARTTMSELAEEARPDVVYIDPMYPVLGTSALPQKEMRLCRAVVGDDADAPALLAAARRAARRRVVVKRHRDAPLLDPGRSLVVAGRRVRYDVYLTADGTSSGPQCGYST